MALQVLQMAAHVESQIAGKIFADPVQDQVCHALCGFQKYISRESFRDKHVDVSIEDIFSFDISGEAEKRVWLHRELAKFMVGHPQLGSPFKCFAADIQKAHGRKRDPAGELIRSSDHRKLDEMGGFALQVSAYIKNGNGIFFSWKQGEKSRTHQAGQHR